ncbi:hypothetical protein P154DRAFT_576293 [Amniculicola lignicola CBS 123094]|uniref:Uncharacterized protein n=1 Tax=Amniculicola lignicola CBS 123094 TaxID=1392246 RepID=A0A6A5WHJ3_9PLEO|nr:hypothetical protein P154DRAFT_576293 [Amniculicola lignicola CBS 123094]
MRSRSGAQASSSVVRNWPRDGIPGSSIQHRSRGSSARCGCAVFKYHYLPSWHARTGLASGGRDAQRASCHPLALDVSTKRFKPLAAAAAAASTKTEVFTIDKTPRQSPSNSTRHVSRHHSKVSVQRAKASSDGLALFCTLRATKILPRFTTARRRRRRREIHLRNITYVTPADSLEEQSDMWKPSARLACASEASPDHCWQP